MTDTVPVTVPCEQHPEGDTVYLKPTLGLAGGVEVQAAILDLGKGVTANQVQGIIAELYVRHGVADWTLHDDAGNPVALTPQTLQARLLDDFSMAKPLADRADELYGKAVVVPLAMRVAESSRAMRAARSTSAPTGSPASPRKRSKRSSTSTSPTAATATTSA